MAIPQNNVVTVEATINAPIEKVWERWTNPNHIVNWNNASDDWYTPFAENDLRPGGTFTYRMAARDGSFAFDFGGTYDDVHQLELISYVIADGRHVQITFEAHDNQTIVTESFEAEQQNAIDLQRDGWQAIMNNFKRYAEGVQ
jgi:uncharacterized protein YndB with AHSA1/START domain